MTSKWNGKDLRGEFEKFHAANPRVYELVCQFAEESIGRGFKKFAIQPIMDRIRWELSVPTKAQTPGEERFRLPNNHHAYYARLWMEDHPMHAGFFRICELRSETDCHVDRYGVAVSQGLGG